MKNSILLRFDKAWCGNHQVPASLLLDFSEDEETASSIALYRFLLFLSLFGELLGFFFLTYGLVSGRPVSIFFIGIFLKMSGSVLGALFQNKAGSLITLELQNYLEKLRKHSIEIHSFLSESGCSESEINSLSTLPSQVYQSELNSYQTARILHIGSPLFCGLGLLANGDTMTALLVITLGLLSFPIGERFFRENTFRKESELRLGIASQLLMYVKQVYQEHIWLTVKVNFLSQLPLLLFAFRFLFNGSGHLLSSFYGLTQGLAGLTGTLAFQKTRAAAIRTTETAKHLMQALSNPSLIVTPKRWKEHIEAHESFEKERLGFKKPGVLLDEFAPVAPFFRAKDFSISCFIPSGKTCLLQAPSGRGKSLFLATVTHLVEHTGDLLFIDDDKQVNVHELSREEFDRQVFYFREESIEHSARIIDLFKEISFEKNEEMLLQAKSHFSPLLVDLAWKSPDNLLSQEIHLIEAGRPSVFPKHMLDFLKKIRERQSNLIVDILKQSGGNLSSDRMFPERSFSTLSAGEKRRIVSLLALESCRLGKKRLVILDEPFTHLDQQNVEYQMELIKQLLEFQVPPSLLLISHLFQKEIKERLNCEEVVFLDSEQKTV